MSKKFIFSIVIVIIVLFVVSGTVWFVFQNNSSNIPPVQEKNSVEYVSNQYGFSFILPLDWEGYSIVTSTWRGDTISPSGQVQVASLQGPMISIRNPLWTVQTPYQDIPIMIFTLAQWGDLQQDKFHIGAAPINPSEFGSNTIYIFALPARYNYAYPVGWQEVDQIIKSNPLQTFQPISSIPNSVTRKVGDKEFNFLIQKINANSVDGLWYILYPVAMLQGQPKTLQIGDTVGYSCEGKTATLSSIDAVNQTVTFNETIKNPPIGGCPI